MKALRILFFSLIIILGVIFLFSFLSIRSNLNKLNIDANKKWEELFDLSIKKNAILKEHFITIGKIKNVEIKLFIDTINKNLEERYKYKKSCNMEYMYREFIINKIQMKIKDEFEDKKYEEITNKFNNELNIKIDLYNNSAVNFNKYYTLFPNILVAKHLKLKRKKTFTIKYGVVNEDPIIRENKLPEWALGIDTSFIKH